MNISLIVATRGRVRELDELFESLAAQAEPGLEVIVVDQNADDRLAPVIAAWSDRLVLRWERSARAHANHARNLGLAMARGEIVGFPDDDCTFPPGVLARVLGAFAAEPGLAVLTGPAASPAGGLGSGRWRRSPGPIDEANVWTSVIEFNLFLRRRVALILGGFDERLGPGTELGSTEGNDLVLRAIRAGFVARYDPAQRIVHPDKRLTPVAVDRAALYARGMGFVLRRHEASPWVWLPFMVRPAGGALLSLLRGDVLAARYYAETLRGRAAGYLMHDADLGLPLPALAEAVEVRRPLPALAEAAEVRLPLPALAEA
ncbi:glycosyltransferase family 2 protein [Roseicella aquatilis]|uniref:Glycosyltransferase family 2 protein n=1 Tax=Roseicella aquatilis TaxID=2527868 RepID=A0A4R4DWC8_9PROT|nr:glycosyltransferase family A protein [Roseicella aquatilis]TCZ66895.1 glycosyltransferase family 2 protein [Roseicella aquatilis]